jgi:hypothetical protein
MMSRTANFGLALELGASTAEVKLSWMTIFNFTFSIPIPSSTSQLEESRSCLIYGLPSNAPASVTSRNISLSPANDALPEVQARLTSLTKSLDTLHEPYPSPIPPIQRRKLMTEDHRVRKILKQILATSMCLEIRQLQVHL